MQSLQYIFAKDLPIRHAREHEAKRSMQESFASDISLRVHYDEAENQKAKGSIEKTELFSTSLKDDSKLIVF